MTTAKELMAHDFAENRRMIERYRKSSSLPFRERMMNKPKGKCYRRDKVLLKIINNDMSKAVRDAHCGDDK